MHIDLPLDDIISQEKKPRHGNRDRRTQMGGVHRFNGGRRHHPQPWLRKQDSFRPDAAKKILISNLSFQVNDSDIYELFREVGNINKSMVNYDRSGRSRGTAEVIYYRREDAAAAVRRYQNVPLDGRPLKIEYISTGSNIIRRDTWRKPVSRARFSSRGNGNKERFSKSYVRKAKSSPPNKVIMTKEALDAQLEAYKRAADGDDID
ncbi:Aly/REF export factor 2 [Thelohanellus kitauei]|uniref:Aly/REF export factor 2 n=1 Tax=Thelohanellus kitauei TaxID=669202 RepID=A0A0C2MXE2_THEKT|nr:Aly/REF export factor 2 [Thelohanellus kitauei]